MKRVNILQLFIFHLADKEGDDNIWKGLCADNSNGDIKQSDDDLRLLCL